MMDRIIYQISVEDLQYVAEQEIDRKLSEAEIKILEKKVGGNIAWYEAIADAINEAGIIEIDSST